ncbi:TetR/AcrR family transcriptional regulator [Lentzea sp. NPDC060358]|uniref:TetR/AcrR family transcriptional regulator n=1 Tax=Lentzea sp. NPDC060358 TaxID=3347103 RepID=UPI00366323F0
MPPDATETKRRLLKAAIDEFATYGLAGARVDRIAEQASANKRSIYMHFGAKEELFDRVVGDCMAELAAAVVVDAGDLPRYAGALFEQLEGRPHVRRLHLWAGLERQQPVEAEVVEYRRNVAAIAAAQEAGTVRSDIPAVELLAMVVALVISWDTASWSLKALGDDSFAGRKAAVQAAVEGMVRP